MQAIEGARLIPGARVGDPVAAERLPGPADGKLIRGKALIFWDPKVPGKKLDAIDTDQITPADDCVSESLDTLRALEGGVVPLPHAELQRARAPRRDVRHRRRSLRHRELA